MRGKDVRPGSSLGGHEQTYKVLSPRRSGLVPLAPGHVSLSAAFEDVWPPARVEQEHDDLNAAVGDDKVKEQVGAQVVELGLDLREPDCKFLVRGSDNGPTLLVNANDPEDGFAV